MNNDAIHSIAISSEPFELACTTKPKFEICIHPDDDGYARIELNRETVRLLFDKLNDAHNAGADWPRLTVDEAW